MCETLIVHCQLLAHTLFGLLVQFLVLYGVLCVR